MKLVSPVLAGSTQAPVLAVSADPAKTGEASSVNDQAGEASNPAGSELTPQTESQTAAPEANVIAKPSSPTPAATPTAEAQTEEPQAESAADPNLATVDATST